MEHQQQIGRVPLPVGQILRGDVNNVDGDMEIVAIKSNGSTGTLMVVDPVVQSGAFDNKTPNGIPYAILYETTIPGDANNCRHWQRSQLAG
ncbi:MAG: hypothetical protein R2867_00155 [Caldilineaceae bacterium]